MEALLEVPETYIPLNIIHRSDNQVVAAHRHQLFGTTLKNVPFSYLAESLPGRTRAEQ